MHSRWYTAAVVLLWVATMSWLVHQKVLPPLIIGEPPSFRSILEVQRQQPPVGWKLLLNGREMGWGLSQTVPMASGVSEVRGHVHLNRLPLEEVTRGWARALVQLIPQPTNRLEVDAQSHLTIDALGRLLDFESTVRFEPLRRLVRVQGTVEGTQVNLTVRVGEVSYQTEVSVPANGMLGNALSPQSDLPGLRPGQIWTVPSYNPLCPRDPLEILQAQVEGREPIQWGGKRIDTWLVAYRSDSGSQLGGDPTPRQQLWVRFDGRVLKQQVIFLESELTFLRMSDEESAQLAARAADKSAREKNAAVHAHDAGADESSPEQ